MQALYQPFPMQGGRRAQVWRHQPEFRRPRHFHQEPELNVVTQGSALIGVGEKVVAVSAGELLLFAPGQDHVLLSASDDLDMFVLALRPELAERACGSLSLLPRGPGWGAGEMAGVVAELRGIGNASDDGAVELRLAELFRGLWRAPSGTHVLSRRAAQCVREEPALTGSTLAERLGTAPSHVSRHFHRDFGLTFVEYRARSRLMRFVDLVDQGQTFSEAALAADFGSYAQCHRVFTRLVRVSPRDYFRGARAELDQAVIESSR